jgi:hypothetical protein
MGVCRGVFYSLTLMSHTDHAPEILRVPAIYTDCLPRPACGERVGVRGCFWSPDSSVWRTPSKFSMTSLFQMRISR